MGSVCAEQHHKFHTSHQLQLLNKKSLLSQIDIPPRKLLGRRENEVFAAADSPRSSAEEALMQKYLPYNDAAGDDTDSDSDDPYSSDHFRMYDFKVRRCTRSRSHDWTNCPFAHPGEKARRRDPRRHHYSGTVCAEFRRGGACGRGDNCEFAHGVFECWLHPARYRTEACKDGRNCKRKVCFFGHSPRQLRLLPPQHDGDSSPPPEAKFRRNSNPSHHHQHCCLYCHSPVSASPTSTLMGGPHLSSPISRYGGGDRGRFSAVDLGYSKEDSFSELICSLEGMNLNMSEVSPHAVRGNNGNLSWVDVCLNNNFEDQQQLFVLSPCTPSPSGSGGYFSNCDSSSSRSFNFEDKSSESGLGCPDLGWVNDLLT